MLRILFLSQVLLLHMLHFCNLLLLFLHLSFFLRTLRDHFYHILEILLLLIFFDLVGMLFLFVLFHFRILVCPLTDYLLFPLQVYILYIILVLLMLGCLFFLISIIYHVLVLLVVVLLDYLRAYPLKLC